MTTGNIEEQSQIIWSAFHLGTWLFWISMPPVEIDMQVYTNLFIYYDACKLYSPLDYMLGCEDEYGFVADKIGQRIF